MKCQSIKNNIKKVCTADFNKKIIVQKYGSYGNNSPDADVLLIYQTLATVFAMVKTSASGDFINNVNVSNTITIDFYIRYSK